MKYIRTKNGIYDYEPTHNIDVDGFVVQHINGWNKPLTKEDIIKIADTIEELCDEFVIKVDNEYLHAKYYPIDRTFYIYNTDEEISLGECLRFNYVVKGAIWTDKGLVHVAKMNDKGELELL